MDNCCDTRLRTFVKIPSEKFKGFLKNVKKLHFSYPEASLSEHDIEADIGNREAAKGVQLPKKL